VNQAFVIFPSPIVVLELECEKEGWSNGKRGKEMPQVLTVFTKFESCHCKQQALLLLLPCNVLSVLQK
jgi:hypothetical protein